MALFTGTTIAGILAIGGASTAFGYFVGKVGEAVNDTGEAVENTGQGLLYAAVAGAVVYYVGHKAGYL